jgi:hypothetical protein
MPLSTYASASAEANFKHTSPPPRRSICGDQPFIADAERVHIIILTSTDLQPGICHDDPVISTSNSEHTMDSGSTTGPVISLPGDISSKPPPSTSSGEVSYLDPGESTIPEPVTNINSGVSRQAIKENDPISVERYLPNETKFYFNDSLQVPAQDVPTCNAEHNHLIQGPRFGSRRCFSNTDHLQEGMRSVRPTISTSRVTDRYGYHPPAMLIHCTLNTPYEVQCIKFH